MSKCLILALLSGMLAAGSAAAAQQTPVPQTPAQQRPAQQRPARLDQLVVPAGFQLSVFTENVPNAREMVLGPQGTVFVGSRIGGRVHAIVDRNRDHKADTVILIASGLDC